MEVERTMIPMKHVIICPNSIERILYRVAFVSSSVYLFFLLLSFSTPTVRCAYNFVWIPFLCSWFLKTQVFSTCTTKSTTEQYTFGTQHTKSRFYRLNSIQKTKDPRKKKQDKEKEREKKNVFGRFYVFTLQFSIRRRRMRRTENYVVWMCSFPFVAFHFCMLYLLCSCFNLYFNSMCIESILLSGSIENKQIVIWFLRKRKRFDMMMVMYDGEILFL